MTMHDQTNSGRRSFFARLLAGATALAAAFGTSWSHPPSSRADARRTAGLRVRLHPDAVPRTPEQSTTNG